MKSVIVATRLLAAVAAGCGGAPSQHGPPPAETPPQRAATDRVEKRAGGAEVRVLRTRRLPVEGEACDARAKWNACVLGCDAFFGTELQGDPEYEGRVAKFLNPCGTSGVGSK
jgi:hypothetical protein